MALTAANAAINSWIIANVPDATVSGGAISLDPTVNFLAAVSTQFFVIVAIFAVMGLLVTERERGTLAWVASKPVARGAIWSSKWARRRDRRHRSSRASSRWRPHSASSPFSTARPGIGAFVFAAIGVAASIAFMIAVVLAVSTVISNQSAVAAIGFAVFFLPQLLAGFLPVDITPFLPTSILAWAMGRASGPTWAS